MLLPQAARQPPACPLVPFFPPHPQVMSWAVVEDQAAGAAQVQAALDSMPARLQELERALTELTQEHGSLRQATDDKVGLGCLGRERVAGKLCLSVLRARALCILGCTHHAICLCPDPLTPASLPLPPKPNPRAPCSHYYRRASSWLPTTNERQHWQLSRRAQSRH